MGGVTTRCPCCGSSVESDRPVIDLSRNVVAFGERSTTVRPKVAEFLAVLARAFPAAVRRGEVIAGVWGMNEPDTAADGLRLLAYQARQAMRGWPVSVHGTPVGYVMQIVQR